MKQRGRERKERKDEEAGHTIRKIDVKKEDERVIIHGGREKSYRISCGFKAQTCHVTQRSTSC